MRGFDLILFWIIILLSSLVGVFIINSDFCAYSDLIVFLSIMIGFKISSLTILFNSPLKKNLWDAKNKTYQTELHRIKDYYKHSIVFEVISVVLIFIIPQFNILLCWGAQLGKQSVVLPVLVGSAYCMYKICNDLFRIFTFPTNSNGG